MVADREGKKALPDEAWVVWVYGRCLPNEAGCMYRKGRFHLIQPGLSKREEGLMHPSYWRRRGGSARMRPCVLEGEFLLDQARCFISKRE